MTSQRKNPLETYTDYEATIGIEVHLQLKTASKIFCSCPNEYGSEQNTNICPICTGHPGSLPMLNKKVVDFAIMAGLATNCTISPKSDFARKHYMYPDLPKNYQITQGDVPICLNGFVTIQTPDGQEKKIRLTRIHMEEDAGKNLHTSKGYSLVNLNRAGTPLLEIVSEPDMQTADQARAYLQYLHTLAQYLGISDANMDEGSFRADVNISVKKKTADKLGDRVEVKNINSFKFIAQAIDYEVERQIKALEAGEKIIQETRLWDTKNHQTVFMRSKRDAQDYRYCPEPDLPIIQIDQDWIERIKQTLPELPYDKSKRLQEQYGLSNYEAHILVEDPARADFYEAAVALCKQPKAAANWFLRDVLGYLKEHKLMLATSKITPENFAQLISALHEGVINSKVAQEVFAQMAETGNKPNKIIEEQDLKQIGSADELEGIIKTILENNQNMVEQYKAGKTKLFGFFVGQAMKATKGRANPKMLNDIVKKLLG